MTTYGQADRADVRLGDVALVDGGLAFRLWPDGDRRGPAAAGGPAQRVARGGAPRRSGSRWAYLSTRPRPRWALAVAVKGRLVWREAGGVRILDDTYNANPVSVRAALDALREAPGGGRRWVIFGDMLELGPLTESAAPGGRRPDRRAPGRGARRGGRGDRA